MHALESSASEIFQKFSEKLLQKKIAPCFKATDARLQLQLLSYSLLEVNYLQGLFLRSF